MVVLRSTYMITPDIHDDSLWVPQGTHRNTYTPDPNPLNSSGTPYYYEERDLPDSTTGIDWITDTRMDHDFMWGYHWYSPTPLTRGFSYCVITYSLCSSNLTDIRMRSIGGTLFLIITIHLLLNLENLSLLDISGVFTLLFFGRTNVLIHPVRMDISRTLIPISFMKHLKVLNGRIRDLSLSSFDSWKFSLLTTGNGSGWILSIRSPFIFVEDLGRGDLPGGIGPVNYGFSLFLFLTVDGRTYGRTPLAL